MDLIVNGQAQGDVASALLNNDFNPNILRPWIGKDGRRYIAVNNGQGGLKAVVTNAAATLRKEEWIQLDQVVVKAAKERLNLVADVRGAGLEYTIPNGMGKTILQTETQGDITGAVASMDGLKDAPGDRPEYNLASLPLPIIHKDFSFSARQIATSRNGNTPLDTTMAELAARKVAEHIEQQFCGGTAYDFGWAGGTIKGLRTATNRNTKTLTNPTSSGWTPSVLVTEVLQMRLQAQQDYHFGPYRIYLSPDWDVYLDDDYSTAKGDNTLRERLLKISGISAVTTLDFFSSYDLVMVQMTQDVIRAVVGMEITTVQWESKGGLQQHFKVMGIIVPQIRADHALNSGIVHGSV